MAVKGRERGIRNLIAPCRQRLDIPGWNPPLEVTRFPEVLRRQPGEERIAEALRIDGVHRRSCGEPEESVGAEDGWAARRGESW